MNLMNIILIGYRCTGKTSVGRALAAALGRRFVDTDRAVEALAGISIEALVAGQGWARFREMERCVIRELSAARREVIATGGGAVIDKRNLDYLRQNGWIVWLRAGAEEIMERMRRDPRVRPSLTGEDPLEEVRSVLEQRRATYCRACDLSVDTWGRSVSQVAESILENMPNYIRDNAYVREFNWKRV